MCSSDLLCKFSDRENLQRLRRCLKGKAKEAVQSLLTAPENVSTIISTLEKRFGRPAYVIQELIDKARKMPKLTDDKPTKFLDFATAVQSLVTTAKSLNCQYHLCNPSLLMDLVSKLPLHLKYDWGRSAVDKTSPTLEDFGRWVTRTADAASLFTQPKFERKAEDFERRSDDRKRPAKVLATAGAEEEFQSSSAGVKRVKCLCCDKIGHSITKCFIFTKLDGEKKWKLVTDKKICFSCLEPNHSVKQCEKKKACGKDNCKLPHHPLLHKTNQQLKSTPADVTQPTESVDGKVLVNQRDPAGIKKIYYQILPVSLHGPNTSIKTYALLDNGSYATLLESTVADQLGLTGPKTPLKIKGAGDMVSCDQESRVVSLQISGRSKRKFDLHGVRTKQNLDMPQQSVDISKLPVRQSLLQSLDVESMKNVKPTILIGLDQMHLIATEKLIRNSDNGLVLGRTRLGWTLFGSTDSEQDLGGSVLCLQNHEDLNQLVKEHYKLENLGIRINERMSSSIQDRRATDIMLKTSLRIGQQWETGLLWKSDTAIMPSNKSDALKRLLGIERRMDRDEEFARLYVEKMGYYLDKGFARKLTKEEAGITTNRTWFIPHFGVFNANKPGKIRLVFDAAAKSRGVSLNDHLLTGPDLLVSLPGALLKFRQRAIGFSGDIKDFFPCVKIREEDQQAQRFLWRGTDRQSEPDEYVMQVCIFGAASSPYSCQSIKNLNAKEFESEFPEASHAIARKHYMDDYLDSTDSATEAIKLITEVIEVNRRGGFKTTNWACSSREVLQKIPVELRSTDTDLTIDSDMKTERVLGLIWNPNTDAFGFNLQFHKVDPSVVSGEKRATKRDILKMIMSIFDPLGLLAPFTVKAKIIMQEVWRAGLGWDDFVTDRMNEKWLQWTEELKAITNLTIPRRYSFGTGQLRSRQLHVFCDAGELAYGAVAYIRTETDSGVDVSLVMAKSRVTPLKPISIPRLELQAALIGSRLSNFIKEEMDVKFDEIHYWSDSSTVIFWIRSESRRFKTFVSHRLGEIEELTNLANWKWISTKLNVADLLTKEIDQTITDKDCVWFTGPKFLLQPTDNWPMEKPPTTVNDDVLELKAETVAVMEPPTEVPLPQLNRFSSWLKLIRATGWMNRFLRKCRRQPDTPTGELSVQELDRAELLWAKKVQQEAFALEIAALKNGKPMARDSRLKNLTPVIRDGVLHVDSRLSQRDGLPSNVTSPIILDNRHPYSRLLLAHHHARVGHNGQERMANEIRQKYWILNLRSSVRSIWNNCIKCKIRRARPVAPLMAPLPAVRLESYIKPFTNTGVDYFGPMTVAIGRRHEKRYGEIGRASCRERV